MSSKQINMPEKNSSSNGALAISVQHLSKSYQTYQKPLHRLMQCFIEQKKFYNEFWALNEVSFTVNKGETVGIVGKNGSGKSTLLQLISGILKPSSGTCLTQGRISALLELGAGFNPEFTGMENARLNASIMGLSNDEFEKKLPDIIEFCGLGEFLDRPVKTYSSGMYVRLAFSVAINMDPDILIIDEALAVGDVRFQRKCFRRLDELKNQGVSILLVTHSTDSIINHCDRAIMLNDGQVISQGEPKQVVQDYLELMFSSEIAPSAIPSKAVKDGSDFDPNQDYCPARASYNPSEHRWGDRRALIFDYELISGGENKGISYQSGDPLTVRMRVYFQHDIDDLIYGLTVKTADGNAIYGTNTRINSNVISSQKKGDVLTLDFNLKLNLLNGDYFISLGVAQDDHGKDNIAIDRRYDLIHINIQPTTSAFGLAALYAQVETAPL